MCGCLFEKTSWMGEKKPILHQQRVNKKAAVYLCLKDKYPEWGRRRREGGEGGPRHRSLLQQVPGCCPPGVLLAPGVRSCVPVSLLVVLTELIHEWIHSCVCPAGPGTPSTLHPHAGQPYLLEERFLRVCLSGPSRWFCSDSSRRCSAAPERSSAEFGSFSNLTG